MIIKLIPKQIAELWVFIKHSIQETFEVDVNLDNELFEGYLRSFLIGTRQVWGILNRDKNIAGILVTRIYIEGLTDRRVVGLDHLYAFEVMLQEDWEEGFKTINEFALKNNCQTIIAISSNQRIMQMALKYGFKSRCYLTKEV